jgi:septum site-determining protein MinD
MGRKIGIVSAKGGVGKTIITINVASALSEISRNVVAVDGDIKLSGLSLQLGMYYFPVTLNDVLEEGRNILESLYIHSTGLRIIPASLGMGKGVNLSNLNKVLDNSSLNDNLILIDCPPGLESNALAVIRSCDDVIVVTTPEIPAIADVLKTTELAKKNKCNVLGVIVNRYSKSHEQVSVSEIASTCELPIIGVVPEDSDMKKSVFRRVPSVISSPYSASSIEFRRIAASIAGVRFNPPRYQFLRRFLWKIRK